MFDTATPVLERLRHELTGKDERMFTRKEYLDAGCSQNEYYMQFVTPKATDLVGRFIGLERLLHEPDDMPGISQSNWMEVARYLVVDDTVVKRLRMAHEKCDIWVGILIAKTAARLIRARASERSA